MVARDPEDHPRTGVKASVLIAKARELIGAPYRHQGRARDGLDCIGMVLYVANPFGLLPGARIRADYGRIGQPELEKVVADLCEPITIPIYSGIPAGAMVMIQWPGTRFAQHCALCTGENLIHCCGIMGKVVEHGFRGIWRDRAKSAWWIPGVVNG